MCEGVSPHMFAKGFLLFMASPQKENGYTMIANELLEALARVRINGEARQVFDVILRKTYGFNKKKDRIALSQFCLATGIKKSDVCRAINKLISMEIIIKIDNELGEIYCIQKDFDEWKPLAKKITLAKKIMTVGEKDNPSLAKKIHTKETTTKDSETKESTLRKVGYLKEIPIEDIREFVERFEINEKGVRSKAEDLLLYCERKGKVYKNYKSFLLNAIKKDCRERLNTKPEIRPPEMKMTEEEKKEDMEKRKKMADSMREIGILKPIKH